ncbi:MAG: T9SS type A sorting domain-containing protein [Chlorobi bacterium]|nr:T9SS type A sorting domain-containing protein [Chlorobiota bacterium]
MKNLLSIIIIFILPLSSIGQDSLGYWASNNKTEFSRIRLSDASKTFIGPSIKNFTGGDFGTDNVLYAINSSTHGFYEIDTATGSSTLLGTNPPAIGGHLWMGLAYDVGEGVMYGLSSKGTNPGTSSIYTIDESDGSYTLIGTQNTANAMVCIAIDDNGQMYGLNVGAAGNAMMYLVDKTDGSVTELGTIGQPGSGFGHAMDFDDATNTMYLSTFKSGTAQNTLRIVDLTDGSTTEVGNVGSVTGIFAVTPVTVTSDFSTKDTTPCEGSAVQFTDQSVNATSWSWVFEGGLPPSSNYQNPTVIYNSVGSYDVELTASNGSSSSTELKEGYITVLQQPSPQIIGDSLACKNDIVGYSTLEDTGSVYLWTISGGEIISGDSTSQIAVLWGAPGDGTLDLTETNADTCSGLAETLEITIDNCVGIEENESGSLHIFPNPASDVLNITSGDAINSVAVLDYTGKQLLKVSTGSKHYKINTSELNPGFYLLLIETENAGIRRRIVVR